MELVLGNTQRRTKIIKQQANEQGNLENMAIEHGNSIHVYSFGASKRKSWQLSKACPWCPLPDRIQSYPKAKLRTIGATEAEKSRNDQTIKNQA